MQRELFVREAHATPSLRRWEKAPLRTFARIL
jgi:hypothetical protein